MRAASATVEPTLPVGCILFAVGRIVRISARVSGIITARVPRGARTERQNA